MAAKQPRADKTRGQRQAFEKNRDKLLKLGGCCGICGQPVDTSIHDYLDPLAPVIDHIIPIAKGGHPSDISNLQLAHRWCNRQKSDKLINLARLVPDSDNAIGNNELPLHFDWINYKA